MPKLVPLPMVAEGVPELVVVDGVPYCVVKREGGHRAFVAVCSHKDRPLVPLRMKKGELVCPHHGATFDPDTGKLAKARGNDVPTGLVPVEIRPQPDGTLALCARRRHRKLLAKKTRRKLAERASSSA